MNLEEYGGGDPWTGGAQFCEKREGNKQGLSPGDPTPCNDVGWRLEGCARGRGFRTNALIRPLGEYGRRLKLENELTGEPLHKRWVCGYNSMQRKRSRTQCARHPQNFPLVRLQELWMRPDF